MREFPDFTAQEALRRLTDMGSDGMDLALHFSDKFENTPVDYSNLYQRDHCWGLNHHRPDDGV